MTMRFASGIVASIMDPVIVYGGKDETIWEREGVVVCDAPYSYQIEYVPPGSNSGEPLRSWFRNDGKLHGDTADVPVRFRLPFTPMIAAS